MTAALKLVQYLLICKETGEVPHFPGNEIAYNAVDDFSYAPSIADLSVWATTQEHTKNEAFNHANGDVICWRFFYPRIAKYLGVNVRFLEMMNHLWADVCFRCPISSNSPRGKLGREECSSLRWRIGRKTRKPHGKRYAGNMEGM